MYIERTNHFTCTPDLKSFLLSELLLATQKALSLWMLLKIKAPLLNLVILILKRLQSEYIFFITTANINFTFERCLEVFLVAVLTGFSPEYMYLKRVQVYYESIYRKCVSRIMSNLAK